MTDAHTPTVIASASSAEVRCSCGWGQTWELNHSSKEASTWFAWQAWHQHRLEDAA